MEIQKTSGIVLSSKIIGEADVSSIIITKHYGKRNFIFKGLKKSKSRPKTATEPGTILHLMYYYHENKNFYVVNEFTIQKHFLTIRNDLQKIFHLYFLLETIEKTSGYNDDESAIFDLLAGGIDTLSKTEYYNNLTAFFILRLLKTHGILNEVKKCKICGQENFNNFSLDITDLNPVCGNCSNYSTPFDTEVKNFIEKSLHKKFSTIEHKNFEQEKITDLIFHFALFIENYFHITLNSKKFLFSEKV